MIVWLASYPKSGNTWLRTIIGQFFEKDFNEDKVFENSINNNTGEIKTFFNMGKKNDWKIILNHKTRNLIEKKFKNEMIELGYL